MPVSRLLLFTINMFLAFKFYWILGLAISSSLIIIITSLCQLTECFAFPKPGYLHAVCQKNVLELCNLIFLVSQQQLPVYI